jgi:hypothetical protein
MTTTTIFRKNTLDCFGLLCKLAVLAMTAVLLLTATAPALAQLTVCANQGFSLVSAEPASGIEPITYEWYEKYENNNFSKIPGDQASISFAAGKATAGTYAYVRKARNEACELPSNTYTVEVTAAPAITTQPAASSGACSGDMLTLSVAANDATAYQWQQDGADVTDGAGGTTANYTTAALATNTTYTVVVSNGSCSVTSNAALVTVGAMLPPPYAASTQTWTAGSLTWSDRIAAIPSNCTKAFPASIYGVPTEYDVYNEEYYYTWQCAVNNASLFCPSACGWRMPTYEDYVYLTSLVQWEFIHDQMGIRPICLYPGNPPTAWCQYSVWSVTEQDEEKAWALGSIMPWEVLAAPKSIATGVHCVR